jgi:hypothetical protein
MTGRGTAVGAQIAFYAAGAGIVVEPANTRVNDLLASRCGVTVPTDAPPVP